MKDRDERSLEVVKEWEKQTSGIPGHCTWSQGTLQVLINAALDEQDKITRKELYTMTVKLDGYKAEITNLNKVIAVLIDDVFILKKVASREDMNMAELSRYFEIGERTALEKARISTAGESK